MVSLKSVAAVAILLTSVAAQNSNNYTVDIPSIKPDIKAAWCDGQINTCGTLCDGNANNTCEPTGLTYTCLCNANNSVPGLQYYIPSMPTYLCNALYAVCNEKEGSAAGKARCLANQKADCGTIPIAAYTPAAATTSSASGSSTAAPTGTAAGNGASTATSTSTSAGLAPTMVAGLGAGVFAVGMAAFGVML